MLKVTVNKYSGASLLNTIRQIALTNLTEVRPIGFKVGSFSNNLMISDTVEEDMVEFISSVSSSSFELGQASAHDCYVWKSTVDSVLAVNDLADGNLRVIKKGTEELLHCFEPISVEIYFRADSGKYTADENADYLRSHGYDTSKIQTISSHHSAVTYFSFKKTGELTNDDIYDVTIVPSGSMSEQMIFNRAQMILSAQVDDLHVRIN